MNREFLAACNYFVKSTTLTHQQQVCRLYRDCLKTAFSWASTRDLYLKDAQKIREEFRKNAALDPESAYFFLPASYPPLDTWLIHFWYSEAKKLLADGQKRLEEHRHPDQYISMFFLTRSVTDDSLYSLLGCWWLKVHEKCSSSTWGMIDLLLSVRSV